MSHTGHTDKLFRPPAFLSIDDRRFVCVRMTDNYAVDTLAWLRYLKSKVETATKPVEALLPYHARPAIRTDTFRSGDSPFICTYHDLQERVVSVQVWATENGLFYWHQCGARA